MSKIIEESIKKIVESNDKPEEKITRLIELQYTSTDIRNVEDAIIHIYKDDFNAELAYIDLDAEMEMIAYRNEGIMSISNEKAIEKITEERKGFLEQLQKKLEEYKETKKIPEEPIIEIEETSEAEEEPSETKEETPEQEETSESREESTEAKEETPESEVEISETNAGTSEPVEKPSELKEEIPEIDKELFEPKEEIPEIDKELFEPKEEIPEKEDNPLTELSVTSDDSKESFEPTGGAEKIKTFVGEPVDLFNQYGDVYHDYYRKPIIKSYGIGGAYPEDPIDREMAILRQESESIYAKVNSIKERQALLEQTKKEIAELDKRKESELERLRIEMENRRRAIIQSHEQGVGVLYARLESNNSYSDDTSLKIGL